MNFRGFFLIFLLIASAQLIASESSESEEFEPNMEQEILRQLEQINLMGKNWDQKLKEARSQRNKSLNDDENLNQVM